MIHNLKIIIYNKIKITQHETTICLDNKLVMTDSQGQLSKFSSKPETNPLPFFCYCIVKAETGTIIENRTYFVMAC